MERDLRLVQQRRIERDHANGIGLDASPPNEVGDIVLPETEIHGEEMLIDNTVDDPEALQLVADIVVERTPVPGANVAAPETSPTDEQAPRNANQKDVITEQRMPKDSANSTGLAITMSSDGIAHSPEGTNVAENKLTEPGAAAEAPVDMSEAVNIDFDSIFNDTDMDGAEDALNFDFGVSTDPAMGQSILNDTSFENSTMSNANNADLANVSLNANEDIEGVLPGLENYLNTDTDFSNISISAVTTLAETSQTPAVPAERVATTAEAPAQGPNNPVTTQTSFDNFFEDFDMGGTDDLGDGTLGDLDDFDWS